ncbi:MAG: hypothetical protein ABIP46_10845 [Polaromonas sp.]
MSLSFAQTAVSPPGSPPAATAAVAPPASSLPDKFIQRIRTEDSGTRIDEVRVGGETQSITVQPKSGSKLPPYEIKPSEGAKGGPPSTSSSDTNGARVWNVMKF